MYASDMFVTNYMLHYSNYQVDMDSNHIATDAISCYTNRLNLAESIKFGHPTGDATARNAHATITTALAEEGETPAREPFGAFPLRTTILVIGPTGCGKSATINAMLGEKVCDTSAMSACTKKVGLPTPRLSPTLHQSDFADQQRTNFGTTIEFVMQDSTRTRSKQTETKHQSCLTVVQSCACNRLLSLQPAAAG